MRDSSGDDTRRIDLCLRAAGPGAWNTQQRVIDWLDRLLEDGEIDDYRVQTWGKVASPSGALAETRFHSAAVRTVREFEDWAEDCDDVDLPFDREEYHCEFTDQRHTMIRLPLVCLGVYEGDELVEVYPRSEGDDRLNVRDALLAEGTGGDGESAELPGDLASQSKTG